MDTRYAPPSWRRRIVRSSGILFALVAWALVGAIVLQVYLAGAGTFSHPSHLQTHRSWVLWFQDWPLLLFALSFPLRLPWPTRLMTLLLRGLIGAQFGLLELAPHLVSGLHTVNALVIFGLSWHLARIGTRLVRHPNTDERRQ